PAARKAPAPDRPRDATPTWFWLFAGIGIAAMIVIALVLTWERLEIFKMLLASFFPLALLILAVLGSIVFGLATPAEAAAVGAFGGFLLTVAYRYVDPYRRHGAGKAIGTTSREVGVILKDSSFLCAKTTAMVCWLFVGSAIFSAAFALLGGHAVHQRWGVSVVPPRPA